jgi:peptidoglycan hydrolase-like protein with peptidoglycan-binding domain
VGIVALVSVALGSVFGWAAKTLFSAPPPLPAGAAYSVVEVNEGELSRTVAINATASWSGGDQLVNQSAGVLTQRLIPSGETVSPGDVVYTVGLAPVAVAVGDVPAFRDLALGARGADVTQLQQMLVDTGHRSQAPDGVLGPATLAQYKAWQRATGIPVTDSAPLGSLLFVSSLPAVVGWADVAEPSADGSPGPDVKGVVGTTLAPGDAVARFLPPVPAFSMDLPPGQRRLVEAGMPVTLGLGEHQWQAVIEAIEAPREDGSAKATLAPVDGTQSICGEGCRAIPIAGTGSIAATITVLAPTPGLIVPSAALAVAADGSTAVVSAEGQTIPVTVSAIVGGQALVEGVPAGTEVRASGGDGASVPQPGPGSGESGPTSPASTDPEPGEGEPDQ